MNNVDGRRMYWMKACKKGKRNKNREEKVHFSLNRQFGIMQSCSAQTYCSTSCLTWHSRYKYIHSSNIYTIDASGDKLELIVFHWSFLHPPAAFLSHQLAYIFCKASKERNKERTKEGGKKRCIIKLSFTTKRSLN